MKTKILKIYEKNIDKEKIKFAADVLRKGGLVVFPTETVYGLGANSFDSRAVKKIFKVKNRPSDNPLIVHIANKRDIYKLSKEVSKEAVKLMDKCWPGPLTIILKKSEIVPYETCGGRETIAIRMPSNKIALELIKSAKIPIAAPSANLSGKPSPTSKEHVIEDLYGKVEVIIDGGETEIGLESTIVDFTVAPPVLLRPGKISLENLRNVLGKIRIHPYVRGFVKRECIKNFETDVIAPGMKYKHYSPNAYLILVEGKKENIRKKIKEIVKKYKSKNKKVGLIITEDYYGKELTKFVCADFNLIAKNLFKIFREFDKKGTDIIIVEGVKEKNIGLAIMNRLRKAASEIIKV